MKKKIGLKNVGQLLSPGVWLVQDEGRSRQLILKIGELRELYPYAWMAQDIEQFSNFLTYYSKLYSLESLQVNDDGSFHYVIPSSNERAKEILKFLSLSLEKRKEKIEELVGSIEELDSDGNLRDGRGKLISRRFTPEACKARIKQLEEELVYLKEKLEKRQS